MRCQRIESQGFQIDLARIYEYMSVIGVRAFGEEGGGGGCLH